MDAYGRAWQEVGQRVNAGRSWSGRERHCLFLNTRDGRFAEASYAAGVDFPEDGRALALVDWDHDGDLDAWITARSAPRLRLLRNRGGGGKHVTLRLRGVSSNRDAIGARVTIELKNGKPIIDAVRAGEGFLSQSSKTLTIGLGNGQIHRVMVRWPGGGQEVFSGVQPGGRFLLEQGTQAAKALTKRPTVSLAPKPMNIESGGRSATFLARPPPFPAVQYTDFKGKTRQISSRDNRSILVAVWSRWCPPCLAELKELHEKRAALDKAGIDVIAVNVDRLSATKVGEAEDVTDKALAEVLAKTGAKFAAGTLDDRAMGRVEMLNRLLFTWRRPMPLPSSYLIDGRGMLRATYRGRIDIQRLLGDQSVVPAGPDAWLARSAFGRGTYHATPGQLAFFEFGRFYIKHGHEDAALLYFDAAVAQDQKDANAWNMTGALLGKKGKMDEARKRFEKAIEADPKHAEALNNLAQLSMRQRNPQAALGYWARAVRAAPNNPIMRHAYGIALANMGQLKLGREQLLKARELDPKAPVERPLAAIEADLARRVGK